MKLLRLIHTVIWFSLFWLFLLVTVGYFVLILPLFLPFLSRYQPNAVGFIGRFWGWFTVITAGSKVVVHGREHIPNDGKFCVVSNHESNFDIPITLSVFPMTLGFIAKVELSKMPIMGFWMTKMGCVFLDRSNRRAAKAAIEEGAQNIRNGKAMVIFPEGTRSKELAMGRFKPGSLKLPILSQTKIIPVTIDGSYRIYEKYGCRISPHTVHYTIHPPVFLSDATPDMSQELSDALWVTIDKALQK